MLPKFLARHHASCTMTCVEANAAVVSLAARFFGCARGPRLRMHCSTADAFLRRHPRGRYDAIFLDVSARGGGAPESCLAPPPSLATHEACSALRMRLRPGGALIVNVLGSAAHERRVCAALASAFDGRAELMRLLRTAEGNAVLVGVRNGQVHEHDGSTAGDQGAGGVEMEAPSCVDLEPPEGWLPACEALDLAVERVWA